MNTINQVLEGLSQKYAGNIKEIRGFSYIPWNDAVDVANAIFGPMGWSSDVKDIRVISTENTTGVMAVVRVTVEAYNTEGSYTERSYHDGVGYGDIVSTSKGQDLIDTAVKAAASDALSRAFKLFGDAFGLYLYDKDNSSQQASSNTSRPASSSGGDLGPRPSTGQAAALSKNFGLTADQIATISFKSWKGAIDAIWNKDPQAKMTVEQAREHFNLPAPANQGKGLLDRAS